MRVFVLALVAVSAAAAFARDDLFWFNFAVNAEPWKNGILLHFDQEIEFDNSKLTDEVPCNLYGIMVHCALNKFVQ